MKFSVIIPTHKRADKLARAAESVFQQPHIDWEMIIVNDSPDDTSYFAFEGNLTDPRIVYLKNDQNSGVNFSRNRALDNVSKDSDWVIFLDDDDYLAPDALTTFIDLIKTFPDKKWLVTNRAEHNGNSLTKFPRTDITYNYAWDYLITKRCKGDATHCISTTLTKNIRFSKHIKQAEEWLFFYQLGLHEQMFYHDHNSTLTDGYNESTGLNFRKRQKMEQLSTLFAIKLEGFRLHLIYHPAFLAYLFLRFIRILVKN